MKEIQLTQGKVTLVDDDVYKWASQFKWHILTSRKRLYVVRRSKRVFGKQIHILLHRAILEAPTGMGVDHINGDSLDNRRENLRLATNAENMQNRGRYSNNASGFKGVTWYKERKKWVARIGIDGHQIYLGMFDDPVEAALAYDTAARQYHGGFANTNFEESTEDEEI